MENSKKLVISNWKDYIKNEAEAREILENVNDYLDSLAETKEPSLVFCPNNQLLSLVQGLLHNSHLGHCSFLGSQDAFEDNMDDLRYSIVGHSSRRWGMGETDEIVNKKLISILNKEIIPIVCIGEKEKDSDPYNFIKNQTMMTFGNIGAEDIQKCIIAYEPVWAISANQNAEPDTPESASAKISYIREFMAENWKLETKDVPAVLYGGSVNSENVSGFLSGDEIAGVLIGKASTIKQEFLKILSSIININK